MLHVGNKCADRKNGNHKRRKQCTAYKQHNDDYCRGGPPEPSLRANQRSVLIGGAHREGRPYCNRTSREQHWIDRCEVVSLSFQYDECDETNHKRPTQKPKLFETLGEEQRPQTYDPDWSVQRMNEQDLLP